jgi:hypothetical protein
MANCILLGKLFYINIAHTSSSMAFFGCTVKWSDWQQIYLLTFLGEKKLNFPSGGYNLIRHLTVPHKKNAYCELEIIIKHRK